MPMASAQVKSAVLLAGLFADGVTVVTEPARTRDHTELALEEFGATIEKHGKTTRVHGLHSGRNGSSNGGGKLVAKSLDVPGDLSSAVFFIAAASLFPGVKPAHPQRGLESHAHRGARFIFVHGRIHSDALAAQRARRNRRRPGGEGGAAEGRGD